MKRTTYIIKGIADEVERERFNSRKTAQTYLKSEYWRPENFAIIEKTVNIKDMITEQELITLLKLVHNKVPNISENFGYPQDIVNTISYLYEEWFEDGYEF